MVSVYSVDGRSGLDKLTLVVGQMNSNDGVGLHTSPVTDNDFIEIIGYFNGINWIGYSLSTCKLWR